MSRTLILIAALAFARDAHADAKTQKMATGYEREARSCKIQHDGVAKVLERATAMAQEVKPNDLADDISQLRSARDVVQPYCAELAAMIELLRADKSATYKSLEKQIGEHDNKVRTLRKVAKQAVDGVEPIIRRLVPIINKHNTTAKPKPEPAPTPASPAPAPPPTPASAPPPAPATPAVKPAPVPPPVVISDGPSTSMTMRTFTGGGCDDQAARLSKQGRTETWDRAPPKKRAVGLLAWLPAARWRMSYIAGDRFVQTECVPSKTGGYIITLEVPNEPRPNRELFDVGARALAGTANP